MNLHLSELVLDILEPLVETIVGGEELISTEDMVAHFDDNNVKNEGWYEGKWQGGIKYFTSWEPILSAKNFARNSGSQTQQKIPKQR